uniref:Galectin n=1 Tax=Mola mola TaxID=94237 RepID=A0A3Q3VWW8_MOLML
MYNCASQQLELKNVSLTAGDQLRIKGIIRHDTFKDPLRFQIDLGCDADDLALHLNPRFQDDTDGSVLVCNSKTAGCWGEEKRELHNPLQRGTEVKVRSFRPDHKKHVELPDEHEVRFPNRDNIDVISYIKIAGDFKLTSFKIYLTKEHLL